MLTPVADCSSLAAFRIPIHTTRRHIGTRIRIPTRIRISQITPLTERVDTAMPITLADLQFAATLRMMPDEDFLLCGTQKSRRTMNHRLF